MVKLSADPEHHERGSEKLYHNGSDYFASTVVLISLDGFRPDYLNRGITPNLRQFGKFFKFYFKPSFFNFLHVY